MSAQLQTTRLDERPSEPVVSPGSRSSFRYIRQTLLTALPLVISDFTAVFAAIIVVYGIMSLTSAAVVLQPLVIAFRTAIRLVLIAFVQRSYPGCGINPVSEFKNGAIATTGAFALLILVNFAQLQTFADGLFLLGAFLLTLLLIPLFRSLARSLCARFRWWGFPAIVFLLPDGKDVFEELVANRRMGIRPVGIIAEPHSIWQSEYVDSDEFLGPPEETLAIAEHHAAYWGIISGHNLQASTEESRRAMETQLAHFPNVLVLSKGCELNSLWSQSVDLRDMHGTMFESRLTLQSERSLKRFSDLIIGSLVFVLCLPIIALLALAIKWTSPGPAFYGHRRLGRNGKSFRAWKLRSMHVNADQLLAKYLASDASLQKEWDATHKLKSDPRITRIGRLLRATSLDELPQIWNVLRGEMSLVGPRPIVDEEVAKYRDTYQLYLRVTPGVTGLWQISGRNHTTYEERVAYDAYYVRNWSLWLDLYILFRTIKVVLWREGAF